MDPIQHRRKQDGCLQRIPHLDHLNYGDKKNTIISRDTVPSQRGDIYMVALVTTLQANLQLIISVPLKNSTEWPLQYRKEDSVHHRSLGAIAGELRSISALDDQELCLEGDVTAWRAHPLRHPPHLEPESAHEPLVPATQSLRDFSFSFLVLFFFIVNQVLSFLHSIFDICIPNYPLEGLASFK